MSAEETTSAILQATEDEQKAAWDRYVLLSRDIYESAVAALEYAVQSPIEMRLGLHMLSMGLDHICPAHVVGPEDDCVPFDVAVGMAQGHGHVLLIEPQAKLGRYRVDFRVSCVANDREATTVLVECDGHDFHEKTKRQAAHDKQRSRELLRQGYDVIRFTGSEIYKNAPGCADEVWTLLRELRRTRRRIV